MTPRTLFTIILKIFGLYLAINLLTIIPLVIGELPQLLAFGSDSVSIAIVIIGILVVMVIFYFLIRLFLFKTGWIIDKLKLDRHFEQEIIAVKFESGAVIQIAIIILGGLLFIDALPTLFKEIIKYLQHTQVESFLVMEPVFATMVFWCCQLTLGYLLLTNSKRITHWIEQRNSGKENPTEGENEAENREE